MIRKATQADAAAIEAFLVQHAETSMFLRGNLASQGVGQTDHPHSTDFYVWDTAGIAAVFGHTKGGNLMAQAPNAPLEAFTAFADAIAGREVIGMTGRTDCVRATLAACGLTGPYSLERTEPLYRLSLDALQDPMAELQPVTEDNLSTFTDWSAGYVLETGISADANAARIEAERRARTAPGGPARLMVEDGAPVAMAALNAQVADMVQVGGVYVPPALRRAGRGGRVTAAVLAEARAKGRRTAILFAASEAAARVYEAIGFQWIGTYHVALLPAPREVAP